jgi:hypothetical protein
MEESRVCAGGRRRRGKNRYQTRQEWTGNMG